MSRSAPGAVAVRAGLAGLAQRALAGLHFPQHSHEAGFQRGELVDDVLVGLGPEAGSGLLCVLLNLAGALAGRLDDALLVQAGVGLGLRFLDDTPRLGACLAGRRAIRRAWPRACS